jgi:hypothetical protein
MDDDWVAHFFDKCRNVSNEDMQRLWAKVLAGEANTPGSFSRKTINLVADLNAGDANLFTLLCSFCWELEPHKIVPLVFGLGHNEPGFSKEDCAIYQRHGIYFDTVRHLEALGLVRIDTYEYSLRNTSVVDVYYFDRKMTVRFQPGLPATLPSGHVLLTHAGHELAPHCGAGPIDGFFEFVCEKWPRLAIQTHNSFTVASDETETNHSQPSK